MDDKGVFVSRREVFIFEQIEKFISGQVTREHTALLLGKTERTVSRIARRVETQGLMGVKHGNGSKVPHNKKSKKLEAHVCKLIQDMYFDFNISHIQEVLKASHGITIKYTTLRRWCHKIKVVKKKKRSGSSIVRKKRSRMQNEGFLLQMDGSPHLYNGKDEWSLIAVIDDATNEVPYGEFFKSENTFSCMKVLEQVIRKKGVPWGVYVDRAGWLGGGKRAHFGEFRRACEELGIEVIFANSPQAKGRIERWFQVPQDRLVAEFRLHGITTMKDANTYLQEEFLNNYWNVKHRIEPKSSESKYRPLPIGSDLKEIFTMRYTRKINYDHTFKWKHKTYQLTNPPGQIAGQEIEVRCYPNGETRVYFAGKLQEVQLFDTNLKRIAS